MNDAAVQDYLSALKKANQLEEGVKSAQTLLDARGELFDAATGGAPQAARACP